MNPETSSRVYIVIVNFNGAADTLACIDSLAALDHDDFDIVVVDNCSSDDSVERIRAHIDASDDCPFESGTRATGRVRRAGQSAGPNQRTVHLITLPENTGFTGGNNAGMRYALAQPEAGFVWLVNNDTEVHTDALAALLRARREAERTGQPATMLGSVIMDYDERVRIQTFGGGRIRPLTGMTRPLLRNELLSTLSNPASLPLPDYLTGCSVLMSVDGLREIGLLDDRYFLYWEDAEWSFRCKRLGHRIAVAPDSFVYHRKGATSSRYSVVGYFETRNSLRFFKSYFARFLPIILVLRPVLFAIVSLRRADWAFFRQCVRGYAAFLGERFTPLTGRAAYNSARHDGET